MGQYYEAILINTNNHKIYNLDPLNMLSGSGKLTEHSDLNSSVVKKVIFSLLNQPMFLGWIGDYSSKDDFDKCLNGTYFYAIYENAKNMKEIQPLANLINISDKKEDITSIDANNYLILNNSKKEYIDMNEYIQITKNIEYVLHPLPLLTAIGNGYGSGDYYNEDCVIRVGSWACDKILILTKNHLNEYNLNINEYKNITEEVIFKDY